MSLTQLVIPSLLAGFVAAGFVWYGWSLVEVIGARRAAAERAREEQAEAEREGGPGRPCVMCF